MNDSRKSSDEIDDLDLSNAFPPLTEEEQLQFDAKMDELAKDLAEAIRVHAPLEVIKSFERNGREFMVIEVNSDEIDEFIRKNCSLNDYGYNPETRRYVIAGDQVPFILMRFS